MSGDLSDLIDHGWVSTCCQASLAGGCCFECGEQDEGESAAETTDQIQPRV